MKTSIIAIVPAIKNDIVCPRIAPETPKFAKTRAIDMIALRVACIIRLMLRYCIFSYPMNVEFAVWNSACPNMVRDAIWMKEVICGLLKSCAIGAASKNVIIDSAVPSVNSKVIDAFRMFLICVCLFW